MSRFQKATKKRVKLRMAISGVAGAGKTYSTLAIATAMGERVAVIDTERGSASLYSSEFPFAVLELEHYHPGEYMSAIRDAAAEGFDVLVIDSLSHAWTGEGGVLDISRKKGGFNWKEASPLQEKLIAAILDYPGHVFVTMRSKQEYVISEKGGRIGKIEKVGMAPVQRQGVEYEFDVVGSIQDQTLEIEKSRIGGLQGRSFHRPGADVANVLKDWISDERPPQFKAPAPPPPVAPRPDLDDPRVGGVRPRPDLSRPEVGPDTVLTARDFMCAEVKSAVGKTIAQAEEWQSRACDRLMEIKARGGLDKVSERDKLLVREAYRQRRERYAGQIEQLGAQLGAEALDKALAHYDITGQLRDADPDTLSKVRDKLRRLAKKLSDPPIPKALAEKRAARAELRAMEQRSYSEVDEIIAARDYIARRVEEIPTADRVAAMGHLLTEHGLEVAVAASDAAEEESVGYWSRRALSDNDALAVARLLRAEEREGVGA